MVNRIDRNPASEWYEAWNLNEANVAGLVNGEIAACDLQTADGQGAALLAIFTANSIASS